MPRKKDLFPFKGLEPLLKHRTVMKIQKAVGHMNPVVRVYPDQLAVEGGMVDLGHADPVADVGLAQLFFAVRNDMGCIHKF